MIINILVTLAVIACINLVWYFLKGNQMMHNQILEYGIIKGYLMGLFQTLFVTIMPAAITYHLVSGEILTTVFLYTLLIAAVPLILISIIAGIFLKISGISIAELSEVLNTTHKLQQDAGNILSEEFEDTVEDMYESIHTKHDEDLK